jgi:hypothetical protein
MEQKTDSGNDARRLRQAFIIMLSFTLLLWTVKLVEYFGGLDLSWLGIYPRLLIVIGTLLLYGYPRASRILLPAVYLLGGFAVWLFAREAYHIGASGLVFGMLFFLLTVGILRWDRRAIALSLMVFFLYGGMIWGVLPESREISFESHLSGAVIGILLAFLLRKRDPEPPRKQYSWECEDADDDDFEWPDRL